MTSQATRAPSLGQMLANWLIFCEEIAADLRLQQGASEWLVQSSMVISLKARLHRPPSDGWRGAGKYFALTLL